MIANDEPGVARTGIRGGWLAKYRFPLAWVFNDRVHSSPQIDENWARPEHSLNATNDGHRRFFTRYLSEQLDGRPDLIKKSLPAYRPFGKRGLLDNGRYAALRRDDVELVIDRVARITPTGVVTDGGQEYEADVLVLSTGFDAQQYLPGIEVRGCDGAELPEAWDEDDAVAHLGIMVPGFLSFFLMYGHNTNVGAGGSFISEARGRYIVDVLSLMGRTGTGELDVRPEGLTRWGSGGDAAHSRMAWSHPGLTTYYRNFRGRVVTNSPYCVVNYWAMTREPNLAHFRSMPVRARAA
ncbi:hypothetical protein ACFZC5_34745 [Nocardia gamkensis]|uniref:hypothetical protein n=1 Tax=Nocardia gamkensis TaxID=352869 RepID=UPI0036E2921A